ncbi:glycosyltransferase [Patescibacteria group bacterium]|nr:glycosyltransferase [Patescibacteria group bacterium]
MNQERYQEIFLNPVNERLEIISTEELFDQWEAITGISPEETVFIVIIPVYNEESVLAHSIAHLTNQKLPRGSKMIVHVVTNGCTDNSEAIVKEIIVNNTFDSMEIRLDSIEKAGKALALNHARKIYKEGIMIQLDADTFPTSNAICKLFALLASQENCVAGGIMPKRICGDGNKHILAWQDYFDHQMRTMGGLVGRLLAHKIELVVDFPHNLGSEDTWLEYWTAYNYGAHAVKFLGRHPKSDVGANYPGVMNYEEYILQLFRWVAEYEKLLQEFPELLSAVVMSWKRMEQPSNIIANLKDIKENPENLSFFDKIVAYYFLKVLGKVAKLKKFREKFGKGSNWESPVTDRVGALKI